MLQVEALRADREAHGGLEHTLVDGQFAVGLDAEEEEPVGVIGGGDQLDARAVEPFDEVSRAGHLEAGSLSGDLGRSNHQESRVYDARCLRTQGSSAGSISVASSPPELTLKSTVYTTACPARRVRSPVGATLRPLPARILVPASHTTVVAKSNSRRSSSNGALQVAVVSSVEIRPVAVSE